MSATRLAARSVIRLSPRDSAEDVADFLQGLVTSDVTDNLPVWAGLLNAQGKALFDFIVWRDGNDLLVDAEAAGADALVRRLSLYRLRRAIGIAVDPTLAVHWALVAGSGAMGAVADPRLAALGYRWLAPADTCGTADDAWRAHRLALGVCEGRGELGDGETLWLECNAAELRGVSFTKGCYVGQENTARMNWRQKVARRLLVVPLARSNPARQRIAYPELGWAVDHPRLEGLADDLLPGWFGEL